MAEEGDVSTVQIDRPSGPMPVHLAVPVGEPSWSRVVVVHDAPGMTSPTEESLGSFGGRNTGRLKVV